ncbi:MAG: fatty acyl-AMP ligase [Cyanobacteria bacterium P01_A01_bin.83]
MSINYEVRSGVKPSCASFVDLLLDHVQCKSDKNIYRFLARGETEIAKLSYGELDRQAKAIAAVMQSQTKKGERVLLLYPPGLDFVVAFFACMYAGVIAVPAYPPKPNRRLTRLETIVKDAGASLILTTSSLLSRMEKQLALEPELAAVPWITSDNVELDAANNWVKMAIASDDLALLQYTSGSTGTPKGVMVTQGNLLHNSALVHQAYGHSVASQGVIWLPTYHDMGLIGGVLQPLYGDFPVTLMSPLDFLQKPIRWLRAISNYRATTSGGPNFAYELVCRRVKPEQLAELDLSSWEVAFTGAEPIRAETLDKFAATFEPCGFRREAFYPCYGMAETTLIVTGGLKSAPPLIREIDPVALEQQQVATPQTGEPTRQIVSCGRSAPGLTVAIADPESGRALPEKEIGEIWVAGASVTRGYWQKPTATKASFDAYLSDSGAGPFLRTGDLGFLENGELFVTGRIKDMIIIRGQNYYPQDLELTVEKSHSALKPNSGAAFAIEDGSSERLVIVQEVERTQLRKLDAKAVIATINQAITREHNLQTYATVLVKPGTIPKTSSGKIKRYACKTEFIAGTMAVVGDWSQNPQRREEFRHLQQKVDAVYGKVKNSTKKL